MTRDELLKVEKSYLPGTRVEVSKGSEGEDSEPMKGTVEFVDNEALVHIVLDDGQEITVNANETDLRRLSIDDQILEAETIKNELLASKQHGRDEHNRSNRVRAERN